MVFEDEYQRIKLGKSPIPKLILELKISDQKMNIRVIDDGKGN